LVVIEDATDIVERLRADDIEVISGNAAEHRVLMAGNLKNAKLLLVAIPNGFEAGQIVAQARAANRDLFIVVHAHSASEAAYLSNYGASVVVQGAREIAAAMVAQLPPSASAMQRAQTS